MSVIKFVFTCESCITNIVLLSLSSGVNGRSVGERLLERPNLPPNLGAAGGGDDPRRGLRRPIPRNPPVVRSLC